MLFPLAATLAAAALGVPAGTTGSPPITPSPVEDTLRLAEAVQLAREANPMLQASVLQARAAAERIAPSGAWMNPELSLGLMNRPVSGFGTGEMMTMNAVGVTQMVPWPGRLAAGRLTATARAEADSLAVRETEVMLVARVRGRYAGLAATDRSLEVMRGTIRLLDGFREVAAARYAVGEAIQQDVLQAQVALARMEADLAAMEQERRAGAARLNALLARDPAAPVGALEFRPIGDSLPAVDQLAARALESRPALDAAQARERAADAAVDQQRREWYPDLMVSLQYGQRPRFDDMMSLMVGASIPLFGGSRQRPMVREAEAMRAMERAMTQELRNETWALLAEARAMAERARELDLLYRTRILPQARAAVEAALSAYRVGRTDFMTLVESQMTVNRYAVEQLVLTAQWHEAMAEIDALLGSAEVTP